MFYVSVSTSQFFQGRVSHWKTSRSSWPLRAKAGKGYDLESFSWFRRNNRNNSPWPWLSWLKPRLLPLKATCQHSFGCIPWSHPCNSDFKQTELKGANSVIPWFALLTGRFWCWKAPKKTGRQSPVALPGENVTTWLFGMASTLRHLASTRDVVVACHHSEVMLSIMQPGVKDRSSHHGQWHDHWHSSASIREPVMYWVVKSSCLSRDVNKTSLKQRLAHLWPGQDTLGLQLKMWLQDPKHRVLWAAWFLPVKSWKAIQPFPPFFFASFFFFFKYVYGFLWVYMALLRVYMGIYGLYSQFDYVWLWRQLDMSW